MASVGLLYVGAVLFINGIMLLGWLDAKSAAPMNFFVGGLQVLTPTFIIFTANGDQNTILAASGLYVSIHGGRALASADGGEWR